MENQKLTPEQLIENFEKFKEYLNKIEDPIRKERSLKLVSSIEERLLIAPASGRLEYHNCFPGGLIDHSLRVLMFAVKLKKMLNLDVSIDSLIIVCLFHDLGKVGNLDDDYYLPQDSDWHKEKLGEYYKINKNMFYMTVPHRSLWLCQKFGIELTQNEMIAIMIHDGHYVDDNSSYKMKETPLAIIVHQADALATLKERGKI